MREPPMHIKTADHDELTTPGGWETGDEQSAALLTVGGVLLLLSGRTVESHQPWMPWLMTLLSITLFAVLSAELLTFLLRRRHDDRSRRRGRTIGLMSSAVAAVDSLAAMSVVWGTTDDWLMRAVSMTLAIQWGSALSRRAAHHRRCRLESNLLTDS